MFGKASTRGALLLGVATFSAVTASAQDGGVQMVLGLSERFETGRNVDLDVPATGTSTVSTTRLSFGLTSQTPISLLVFNASSALIVENSFDTDGTVTDLGNPDLSFAFTREIPNAIFEATANYRSDDVDAFDESISVDDSTGTRTDQSASLRFETGRTAPLGFAIGASYDASDYQDTTDPDLFDTTTVNANVETILRFSEIAVGRLGLVYSREDEDDLPQTLTDTAILTAGLDYRVSDGMALALSLGYAKIDREEFGVTDKIRGPVGRAGLVYDMPNGIVTADFTFTRTADEDGRATFSIGREMALPAGSLTARIGASRTDVAGTDVIGLLLWTQDLPDGELAVRIERSMDFDDGADEAVVNSVASVDWTMNINALSSVALDLSYEVSDAPSELVQQTEFGATYNYSLTPDWGLASGLRYTVREDADGSANSPSVFVSISRDFAFRP